MFTNKDGWKELLITIRTVLDMDETLASGPVESDQGELWIGAKPGQRTSLNAIRRILDDFETTRTVYPASKRTESKIPVDRSAERSPDYFVGSGSGSSRFDGESG